MKNSSLTKGIVILCCLLLIVSCHHTAIPPGLQEVRVLRVVSGQTLEVTGIQQLDEVTRVRLIGIDAPDLQQQPWGRAAKEQLEKMIAGEAVLLEFDVQDKDKWKRYLAYVWQNGELLNEKLLAQGAVLAALRTPNHKYDQRFSRAQEWSRLMGQGIWNPDKPMRSTPSEFRAHH